MNSLSTIAGTELKNFYVIGGTLQRDAASYVRRHADNDLYNGLNEGRFCYVLTSRQMGKSSLMVRTAARLREEGWAVVVLDLTAIGQNLSAEQWYDGLVLMMGQQLGLEDELDDFWYANKNIGPLQRWLRAMREIVLRHKTERIVFFVDEIDVVRSLPFSTDEFFSGIRELYNERTVTPELSRLAFCLLGVATPSDLIRDTRTTPFNIGQRVELTDFTEEESEPLSFGLGREVTVADSLLLRVLHWTGGHPYLTQRLCQAVAADASISDDADVDALCEEMFLSPRARERDDNLLFVRERLLRSEADLASLLHLYEDILQGKLAADDETNPLVSVLRLSGITRSERGQLKVRNRIYEHVFDRAWVRANMPDAELQRQRAAFRRGVMRTAAVAAVFIAAISTATVMAVRQKNRADENSTQLRQKAQELTAALNLADERRSQLEIEQGKLIQQQNLTEEQRLLADERRLDAEEQQQVAEEQRRLAEQRQQEAEAQKAEAEKQKTEAENQRGEAESQKAEAERQRSIAEREREKIEIEERSNRDTLVTVPADAKRKALDYYDQVVRLMREKGDLDGEASTLIRIGLVHNSMAERDKAYEYINRALTISRQQKNKTLEARSLSGLGNVYENTGEVRKAIDLFNQSLQLWRELGVRPAIADLQSKLSAKYGDIGESDKGFELVNEAITLSRSSGDRRSEAEALHNFGDLYYSRGERQKALEYFQQSLRLRQELRDKRGEASALGNIGVVYRNLQQPDKALENYNKALPLWREIGDRRNVALILNNIGLAVNQLGQREKALEYFQESLKIHQEINDKTGEARTLNSIGGVYEDQGKRQEALNYFLRALPLRKEVSDTGGEMISHINLGRIYSELKDYQKALDHHSQANQLAQKLKNKLYMATTLNYIGLDYSWLKEKTRAQEVLNQALQLWRELKNKEQETYTLKLISELK